MITIHLITEHNAGGCERIAHAVHRARDLHHEECAGEQQQQERAACRTPRSHQHRRHDVGHRSVS